MQKTRYHLLLQGDSVLKIFKKGIYVPSDLKNKRIALSGTLKDLIFLGPAGAFIVAAYDVVCPPKKNARLRRAFRTLEARASFDMRRAQYRRACAHSHLFFLFGFWVFSFFIMCFTFNLLLDS